MDLWHKLLKWCDHDRGILVAMILSAAIIVCGLSCAPRTPSLIDPAVMVTAPELEREIVVVKAGLEDRRLDAESAMARVEREAAMADAKVGLAVDDLVRQQERNEQIVNTIAGIGGAVAQGTVNPAAIIGGAVQIATLLGVAGAVYDNRRKDKVIANGGKSSK